MRPPVPWWRRVLPGLAVVTAILVIGGHVALWLSDADPVLKWRLTALNAAGWAVVILPAWGVSRWLAVRTGDRR
ncbi:MAG: hypothetical protein ACU0CO_18435 [Shimia sp.]